MVESVLHVWQTMITLICLNMIEREILVLSILKIQRVERKSVTNSASCIWLQTLSRPAWRVVFVNFYDFYWMNNYRNNSNNLDWLQYHTLARWNNSMRKWRPGRSHSSVRWFSIFCELSFSARMTSRSLSARSTSLMERVLEFKKFILSPSMSRCSSWGALCRMKFV